MVVNLVFGGVSLAWTQRAASEGWGLLHQLGVGPMGNALASVILLDLLAYWIHRTYHRIPLLWRFHRAHHSDLELDASTALRFHVGEALITAGARALSIPAIGVSWTGLILYELVTQALGLLSHSSIRVSDPIERWIRFVLVSPQMHWTHHSRDPTDHNGNLGNVFSTWDRLMGTFQVRARREEIEVGLDAYPSLEAASLLPFLTMPLGPACREESLR
jgi:sterol desaturase/sphingolipid hydroxylase (fatty acid hydroxylase superfamily)